VRTAGQSVPDVERRASKSIEDMGDIARLIEAHPALEAALPVDVSQAISR